MKICIIQLERTLSIRIMSLTMPMVHDAVSIVWFCYELMIFSNKKCKITIKFSKYNVFFFLFHFREN